MVFLASEEAFERVELPAISIGLFGHVGSGKTTLLAALTRVLAARGWAQPWTPRELDPTATTSASLHHVGLRTARRRHVWVDSPGSARAVKLAIRAAGQVDAGVLVVACDDGQMRQTAEHVLAARLLGVRSWIVFMTKVDACEGDDELIDMSESETRDLLTRCGLDGDAIPVLRGSPRMVLDPDASAWVVEREGRALESLLAACDELPLVSHDPDAPLWMSISNTFVGRRAGGLIVAGRVARGAVARDQRILLVGPELAWLGEVASLERAGVAVERAEAGDYVGARVLGIERDAVRSGFVMCTPGGAATTTAVRARLRFTARDVFDRVRPIFRGYSPVLYGHNARVPVMFDIDLPAELVMPGDVGEYTLYLTRPAVLPAGTRVVLRDSNAIVAGGEVLAGPIPERMPVPRWTHVKGNQWRWRGVYLYRA